LEKLRVITGWANLHFDNKGALIPGTSPSDSGSESARALLIKVVSGETVVVLEDASKRADVAFSRVIPGRWKNDDANQQPAYVVLIDFSDFEQLIGDRRALDAFNVGWAFFHELDHVANNSVDAEKFEDTGECEKHINKMRRECNLPERTQYFYTRYPAANKNDFRTQYVRLPFDQVINSKKKQRYWVVWDASSVGLGVVNHFGSPLRS
jgi:hypothetical protein